MKTGRYHFKMSAMAANPERMARVPAFFRVIEKHVIVSVSCSFRLEHLRAAAQRLLVPEAYYTPDTNAFKIAFYYLVSHLAIYRKSFRSLPSGDKIDFYFNERPEKGKIISSWEEFISTDPLLRELVGATPRFENDNDFLPLQGADLWAWWIRTWHDDRQIDAYRNQVVSRGVV